MNARYPLHALALLSVVAGSSLASLSAQDAPQFAAPVQLRTGDKVAGSNRAFPSPMLHDVNGDGLLDLVVGDLVGKVTVALRKPGAALAFQAEARLLGADRKPVEFYNW